MKKSFISLMMILIILNTGICAFSQAEQIKEYFNDFNDGSMKNVLAVRNTTIVKNQISYQGSNVYCIDKENAENDKYLKLDSTKSGTPTVVYRFDEIMRGKVVVEADMKINNLTPTRGLFELISPDENAVVRLESYQYYFRLCYEKVSLEINEIPIDDEWHHYMAVADTQDGTFLLYIDGRPVIADKVGSYKNNNMKNGIFGLRTSINTRNLPGFSDAFTGIDNVRAYNVDTEEYTELSSQKYDFDFDYLTIDGAYKGTTAGEFKDNIKTDGLMKITDRNGIEKSDDDYLSQKDILVVSKDRKRSFYSIRLCENEYHALIMGGTPEFFLDEKREQYDSEDASICAISYENDVYIPVRALKKLFDADVMYDGDANKVTVRKDDLRIDISEDETAKNINGRVFVSASEYAKLFSYKYCFNDGLILIDEKKESFESDKQVDWLKNNFLFHADENAVVIDDFKSLEEAVEKARLLWKNGADTDIIIDMKEKEYFRADGLVINGETLNNKNHKLIFRGNKENHAKISGGVKLDKSRFETVKDKNIIKTFPQVSADSILVYDLKQDGITDIGTITSQGHTFEIKPSQMQLYCGRKTQTLARYPNEGYLYTGKVFNKGYGWSDSGNGNNIFEYTDNRVETWKERNDIWAFGYWNDEFSPGNARVYGIDKIKNSITLDGIIRAGISKTERPYYLYNIPEEMDIPGEYWIDSKNCLLYYYPTNEFKNEPLYISCTNDILTELDNCINITFENVDFTYSRDMGAKALWCENILFKNCDFLGMGTYGVIFRECMSSGIYASYFYETGAHSVMLEGGDLTTLTKSNNFVISSKFEETGYRRKTYSASVLSRGVGNFIYKNRIQNNYHMGVYVFGSQHLIKNNSFYNICYESGDAGGVYMYARWSTSQTQVIGNYFEHMRGTPEVYANSNVGVYYDNSTSHTYTYGNVFYDLMSGVFSNCGRENEISGNVFSDMVNNAGALAEKTQLAIYETIKTIPFKGKIWKKENPKLFSMQYDYNPMKAKNTFAANNAFENTNEFTNADPIVLKSYDNVSNGENESIFMDKNNKDFRLKKICDFNNTYINGTTDLCNMGPGKDMTSYIQNKLDRLYIYTDISDSAVANVYLDKQDKISIHLSARSSEDDYVDLKNAVVNYESSNKEVALVSKNGTLSVTGTGKSVISAIVTLYGVTKRIDLNIYTDKYLYDSESSLNKKKITLKFNSDIMALENECKNEKGVVWIPLEEILSKIGFSEKKENGKYIFDYFSQKLEITVRTDKAYYMNREIQLEREPYVKDNILYAPFTVCDSLNLITLYSESKAQGEIYRLNNATGSESELIPDNAKILDLSDLLQNEPDSWTNERAARFEKADGGIKFGEDTKSGLLGVFSYEKEKIPQNTLLKFKYKFNTNAYASIMLNSQQPYCVPWRVSGVDSYFIVLKKDVIEVQKRVNNSQAFILDSVSNDAVSVDKWHDISIGVFDDNGVNRIILNSDGKNIIDVTDNINYSLAGTTRSVLEPKLPSIDKEGYISFGLFTTDSSASCYAALK